jgi:hypothetical protein
MNALASEVDDSIVRDRQANNRSTGAIASEGVLAGVVAASAVAVVFLLVDLVAGEAFRTPQQLGTMLLQLVGASPDASTDGTTALALYTLFHFVAFIAAGVLVSSIVQVTMKQPVAVLLFAILFFAFEVAFTGFVTFVGVQSTTAITPVQVALGNIVASIAMALFFRARHPRLKELSRALENEE